jgi:hypothetical protein
MAIAVTIQVIATVKVSHAVAVELGDKSFPIMPKVLLSLTHCNAKSVGFEVITVVVMKNVIFCDMTQCTPLKSNRRFGETCRFHL